MKYVYLGLIISAICFSCTKKGQANTTNSNKEVKEEPKMEIEGPKVVVSMEKFKQTSTAHFSIDTVKINGDVLTVGIGASGCNGKTWRLELVDSERIMKSNPAQRSLKLVFRSDELCEAYYEKEYSFNISALQLGKSGKVILNLQDYEGSVLYEY